MNNNYSAGTILFIALCMAAILSLLFYYTKNKRERDKEVPIEIFARAVLPSILLTIIFTMCFFRDSLHQFRNIFRFNSQQQHMTLNEAFDEP
jgi:drug/metabolite transporter (DMT)-like permease